MKLNADKSKKGRRMDQAVQAVVGVTVPGNIQVKGMYGTEGHS